VFEQGARPAGMIEMNMGEKNPVNGFGAKAEGPEGLKNSGNRILGCGIDHRNTPLFDNQMNGIKFIPYIARVQCENSAAKIPQLWCRLASSGMLMKRIGGGHKKSAV
jgi:hypothetical protein